MTPAASFPLAGSLNAHTAVSAADANEPSASAGVAHLTQRLAAGDEAAFREFHALYFDRLYQFLLIVTYGESHAAQDALQETLVRVARYARRFDDAEIFWGWLKAVGRSAARDGSRKQRRYLGRLRDFALGRPTLFAEAPSSTPDRLHVNLAEALASLASDDRRLIEGKYFRGETMAELAAENGVTVKAIESRLSRVRQQLAAALRQNLRSP